jgi:hypothetical protein
MTAKAPKIGMNRGNAGKGRPKGAPNKTTALLKDAIIEAAIAAGDGSGLTGYLETQAREQPVAFMTLLGKVLPMQITGENGGPIKAKVTLAFD